MVFIMIYEVVCMCETRCGDADTNYIRNTMEKGGFDIVFFLRIEVHEIGINQEVVYC